MRAESASDDRDRESLAGGISESFQGAAVRARQGLRPDPGADCAFLLVSHGLTSYLLPQKELPEHSTSELVEYYYAFKQTDEYKRLLEEGSIPSKLPAEPTMFHKSTCEVTEPLPALQLCASASACSHSAAKFDAFAFGPEMRTNAQRPRLEVL